MLQHEHTKRQMRKPTNPVIYWKIKELAVTARATVGDLLREAGISSAAAHGWTHGDVTPTRKSLMRLNAAFERLRERNMG